MTDENLFVPRSEFHAYRRDSQQRYVEVDQRLKQLSGEVGDLKVGLASQEKYWAAIEAHLSKDGEQERRIRNIELVQGEIKAQFRVWVLIAIVAIPLLERLLERFVK